MDRMICQSAVELSCFDSSIACHRDQRSCDARLKRTSSIDSRIFRGIGARTQSCSFVLCNRVTQHGLIHADSHSNSSFSRCPCTGDQDLRVDVQIPCPKSESGATCLRDKRRTSCQLCSCFSFSGSLCRSFVLTCVSGTCEY